jgi:hypothetical protein
VVMIVGVIIFTILKREKDFLKLIDANQNIWLKLNVSVFIETFCLHYSFSII